MPAQGFDDVQVCKTLACLAVDSSGQHMDATLTRSPPDSKKNLRSIALLLGGLRRRFGEPEPLHVKRVQVLFA